MPPSCNSSVTRSCLPAPDHLSAGDYAPHAILMMAVKRLRCNGSASLELALELGFGQLDADGAAARAVFDIRAGQDLGHNGTICLLCFRCITIPPSRLRRATSLYTREAIRCGGDGPMSTREGQAASVTLLRREQLRSASAPTKSIVDSPTSIRRKSRARLWSIERVRGNHSKGFPGLFFLLPGVFFLEKQKENAVRFPFSRKKERTGLKNLFSFWRKSQNGSVKNN